MHSVIRSFLVIVLAWACTDQSSAAAAAERDALSIELKASAWTGDLDAMVERRVIRVLVPYSKTLYFVDFGGTQRGLSYDFMRSFEDALNKKLRRGDLRVHTVFIPVSRDRLIPELVAGHGDVIAANLTITPSRSKLVDFVTPVASGVNEILVTGPQARPLRSIDDLAGEEVYVQRSSSYYESLTALNQKFRQRKLAPVRLREAPGHFETEDLLEMTNAGLVKAVVADAYLAHFWKQVYPDIVVHDDLILRKEGDIGFAVRHDNPQLKAELDAFTKSNAQGTLFGNVTLRKYLQSTRWAKNAITQAELQKFNTMVSLFRKYGEQYGIDWLLMVAQGYQESQLDQSRRSHAGAIGVMQLLPATAKDMQVGDITQLETNIHAGIKYVRFMVDTYYQGEPIDELNKVLFAFASYNAGPNRIRSLRKETTALGLDANLWFDNVERVAARRIGRETVQYVSNIYKYYIAYTLVQEEVEANLKRATAPLR